MLLGQVEDIVRYIKGNREEEEGEENVDISIEILPNIFKDVLSNGCKQKADSLINYC